MNEMLLPTSGELEVDIRFDRSQIGTSEFIDRGKRAMVFTKSGNGGVVVDDPVFGVGMEFNGTGGYRHILSSIEYWEKERG